MEIIKNAFIIVGSMWWGLLFFVPLAFLAGYLNYKRQKANQAPKKIRVINDEEYQEDEAAKMVKCFKCGHQAKKQGWRSPTNKPVFRCVNCNRVFWRGKNGRIYQVPAAVYFSRD